MLSDAEGGKKRNKKTKNTAGTPKHRRDESMPVYTLRSELNLTQLQVQKKEKFAQNCFMSKLKMKYMLQK